MALSFMKTGAESAKLAQQAAVEAEMRKESQGKLFRYFLGEVKGTGKYDEGKITFIDGTLNEEGFLLPPRWYEHMKLVNGSWENFVCPEKTNPDSGQKCPICEAGDRATLVAAFTIIDHRFYKSQKGEIYKDTRKLFIAKPNTFEILNKMAVKRGGLAGCTFDVSRTGEKSPAVGNVFDFCEKREIDELKKMYRSLVTDPKTNEKKEVTKFYPANYEEEIIYRSADELRKLGLGNTSTALNPGGNAVAAGTTDYSKEL